MTDIIADMLTTIRNGLQVNKNSVSTPYSKLKVSVLKILQEEGYIKSFKEENIRKGIKRIEISLAYFNGKPSIKKIFRVSKPGRRMYSKVKNLPSYYKGFGITIVSTPKGVMTDKKARNSNLGGEILCQIF